MLHAGHRPEGGALCVRAIIVTRRTRPRAAPQRTRPGRAGRGRGPPSRRDRDRTEWAARPPERVRRRVSAPRCWAISQVDSMTRRAGRLSNGRLRKGSHVVRHGSDNPGRSFFRRAVPTSPGEGSVPLSDTGSGSPGMPRRSGRRPPAALWPRRCPATAPSRLLSSRLVQGPASSTESLCRPRHGRGPQGARRPMTS